MTRGLGCGAGCRRRSGTASSETRADHRLCPGCAADNTARRALSTDLSGRRVLLTGGRVKIGFQLALMMLRDGAELLVTSRFPRDTLRQFAAVEGSRQWLDRLTIVAVDLRDPRQVLGLCERLRVDGEPLDILVNNAAQTIRRPPESYALLARIAAAGIRTPLDIVDGAARVYDPIVRGEAGAPVAGVFLKDYEEADW